MKPTPDPSHGRHVPPDTGPAVEEHGRVLTTDRRAAAWYRQAQRAIDARRALTALRLAVNADPAFGLAVADLCAVTGTPVGVSRRRQMNSERHHIEVVGTAATGDARRATYLLRDHLASVGCDPLAFRIVVQLRQPLASDDDLADLAGQLPDCHRTAWTASQ